MQGLASEAYALSLGEGEVVFQALLYVGQMFAVLEEAAVIVAVLTAVGFTLKVVIAGRTFLIAGGLAAMLDDFLHPPFLGLRSRVDGLVIVAAGVTDTGGDVIALSLKHVGQVELE